MAKAQSTSFLEASVSLLRTYKRLAERAIEQTAAEYLTAQLDSETNSISLIVKHLAGNMRSRRTDFLTADGEKPGRNRDSEFEGPYPGREEMMAAWEEGWALMFAAIESLTEGDLNRTVTIRGEAHSVLEAILRQVAHYASHTGQIVLLAKHFQGGNWKSLSIPRGRSEEFVYAIPDPGGKAPTA
jgi:hypothetical protein